MEIYWGIRALWKYIFPFIKIVKDTFCSFIIASAYIPIKAIVDKKKILDKDFGDTIKEARINN